MVLKWHKKGIYENTKHTTETEQTTADLHKSKMYITNNHNNHQSTKTYNNLKDFVHYATTGIGKGLPRHGSCSCA